MLPMLTMANLIMDLCEQCDDAHFEREKVMFDALTHAQRADRSCVWRKSPTVAPADGTIASPPHRPVTLPGSGQVPAPVMPPGSTSCMIEPLRNPHVIFPAVQRADAPVIYKCTYCIEQQVANVMEEATKMEEDKEQEEKVKLIEKWMVWLDEMD